MDDKERKKKELVNYYLNKNILINPEIFQQGIDLSSLKELSDSDSLLLLNTQEHQQHRKTAHQKNIAIHLADLEDIPLPPEKLQEQPPYTLSLLPDIPSQRDPAVKVIFSYTKKIKTINVQDFVAYFSHRFHALKRMLQARPELQNSVSINRLIAKRDKEQVAAIGMVKSKETSKSGGISMHIEDQTGSIKVFVNKNNKQAFDIARDTVLDQVIGVVGVSGNNILFANTLFEPDIPLNREQKKAPEEVYALFLSDLHIGSKLFLHDKFDKFLSWINGETDKHQELIQKIKYIFVAGDIVDGCSIYPGQERELEILDIYEQYKECANLLSRIPPHINIILSPGNHDAMRISEPQPELQKDFAEPLWNLKNVTMVSNPGMVTIEASRTFPGFDVLLYHGYSFDYYIANVESIRNSGGYDRPDLIMKFLLKKRHLAPTHTSTLYIPDPEKDSLVIEKIPDIFATGHLHKVSASHYHYITLVCGSCWQDKTPFQEKLGHNPEPGRIPLLNLQTREMRILRF